MHHQLTILTIDKHFQNFHWSVSEIMKIFWGHKLFHLLSDIHLRSFRYDRDELYRIWCDRYHPWVFAGLFCAPQQICAVKLAEPQVYGLMMSCVWTQSSTYEICLSLDWWANELLLFAICDEPFQIINTPEKRSLVTALSSYHDY